MRHHSPAQPARRDQLKNLQHVTFHLRRDGRASRRRASLVLAAALVGGIAVVFGASPAAAQTGPVTDYGSYPPSLPAGCPDGSAALAGLRWATGTGRDSGDLSTLGLRPGETVIASWAAFAPGCSGPDGAPTITVSLAAYEGGASPFDPQLDQRLIDGWASCGMDAPGCGRSDGRYQLEVSLPGSGACATQLDLVIGGPLAIVGPSGSYFSAVARNDAGPNLLIASGSLVSGPCAPPVATVPVAEDVAEDVAVTAAPPTTGPVTTTSAATTTPTTPDATSPATTTPPAVSAGALAVSTTLPASAEAIAVSPAELPVTGDNTRRTATVAAIITILGAALVAVGRRRPAAP